MLIEEIKGWYSMDLNLTEGTISWDTVKEWMTVVVKRGNNNNNKNGNNFNDNNNL